MSTIIKKVDRAKEFISQKSAKGREEATQIATEYKDLERKSDSTAAILEHLQGKVKEYLQPNPNARLKMDVASFSNKIKGQTSGSKYPQIEHTIASIMMKGAQDLGEESHFGCALYQCSETFQYLSDARDDMDTSVRQRYLDPVTSVVNKDIKEITHHRKKVAGRRLDYDSKKKKHQKGGITEQELALAAERFEESFNLSEQGMLNLLDNDVEQVRQLLELIKSLEEYHKRSMEIISSCVQNMEDVATAASNKAPMARVPRAALASMYSKRKYDDSDDDEEARGFSDSMGNSSLPAYSAKANSTSLGKPCCKALYDFDAEADHELTFKEGDIIYLDEQLDENWFQGTLNGQSGMFPVNYVNVLVTI